jgi:hypothetical protein
VRELVLLRLGAEAQGVNDLDDLPEVVAALEPVLDLPEDLADQVETVARAVEEIRQLTFDEVPQPVLVTPPEMAERVGELLESYTEEDAERDERLLVLFGAVPEGTDLRALLVSALSQEVAGYYDPDTGELVVLVGEEDDGLSAMAEMTLAHELAHALVDQVIGLPTQPDDPDPAEGDADLAAHALVEGDATLVMLLYVQEVMTADRRAELLREQLEADGNGLAELPHFVRRSLLFPYEEGLVFVTALHAAGGWQEVDDAFEQLPASTLQTLRPDLYLEGAGEPADVRPPGRLDDPWEEVEAARSFGAADLLLLFQAPGGEPGRALEDPLGTATLWRGGEVTLWVDGERSAAGIALVGEDGLCAAVIEWYRQAFPGHDMEEEGEVTSFEGEGRSATIACPDDEVRVGLADEPGIAQRLTD